MGEQVHERTTTDDVLRGRSFLSASVTEHGAERSLVARTGIRLDGRLALTADHTRIVLHERRELWGLTFASVSVTETGTVPAPVVEGTTIRLTFTAPDALTAEAGCNTLGFGVVVDDSQLRVADEVSSTRMLCTDDLMAQDAWLSTFFTDDPAYDLTGSTLTLTRGGTEIVLEVTS